MLASLEFCGLDLCLLRNQRWVAFLSFFFRSECLLRSSCWWKLLAVCRVLATNNQQVNGSLFFFLIFTAGFHLCMHIYIYEYIYTHKSRNHFDVDPLRCVVRRQSDTEMWSKRTWVSLLLPPLFLFLPSPAIFPPSTSSRLLLLFRLSRSPKDWWLLLLLVKVV